MLFTLLVYTPCLNFEVGQGNVASDLAAIESLVERRTFFIDGASFTTIDKFRLPTAQPSGQFFSQKSPVYHLVAAVPYGVLHAAGFSLRESPRLCQAVLTLLLVVVPMGLLLGALDRHPWLATLTARGRGRLVLIFAAGSLLTPFAVTLNHYVPAALFLLLASAALVRAWPGACAPDRASNAAGLHPQAFIWAGCWLGASIACDVPPAFLALAGLLGIVGAAALVRRNAAYLRAAAWCVAGAAPWLLAYGVLNQAIMGSPLPPNLHEEEMLYFPGSFWSEVRAAAERGEPGHYQASYPRRLLHATVGHKGIYWMMPLLVLATCAALMLQRWRSPGWAWALAAAALPLVSIAVTMRWAFDLSGGAYNIRHVIATVPPLFCVLGHPALRPWRRRRALVLRGAAVFGVLVAVPGVWQPWSNNTLSAIPPLQNVARFCLQSPRERPVRWIATLIEATSIDRWNGWLDYGILLWYGGRRGQGAAAMQCATLLRPDRGLAFYHLAIMQAELGYPDQAYRTNQQLLQLEPGNIGAWNNSGTFALAMGLPASAEAAYDHSLQLAPENPTALYGKLRVRRMLGRDAPGDPLLKRALELYPDHEAIRQIARDWGRH